MASGACNCGAVAFEISSEIADVYVCHCSICRRFTGSNGIPVVVVDNSAFRWVRGEDKITTWKKPDADWHSAFCSVCGSSLPGINDPARTFVPVGSIVSGGDKLKVAHHIFVDSRAPWDEIGDSGKLHGEAFVKGD